MLMNRRGKRVLFGMVAFLMMLPSVNAASANISVSTTSTVVGGTGTASIVINGGGKHIGQIYGTFSCGALGNKDLNYVNSSGENITSKTYTISWKANTAGTYTCSVSGLQVGILEEPQNGVASLSATAKTITVKSPATNNNTSGNTGGNSSTKNNTGGGTTADKKKYSTDNYLSSLNIEGYELDPKFDKETLEYKIEVDESVEKITINAKTNDSKATVTGTGEIVLSSGENVIQVKVTAENGNEKTYKIIANVIDKNPIEITIGDDKYTLVKKNNNLIPELDNFEKTVLDFDGQKVDGYKSKNGNITLVILKDSKGNYSYYSYVRNTNGYDADTFTLYRQIESGNLLLLYKDMPNDLIQESYKEYTFTYDGETYIGYITSSDSDYCLFYAMNTVTGEDNLYQYDVKERTIQRYNGEEVEKYKEKLDLYYKYLLGALGLSLLILVLSLIASSSKKRKHKRKVNELKEKINQLEHDLEYASSSSLTSKKKSVKTSGKKASKKKEEVKKEEDEEEDWDGFDPI